MKNAKKVLLTVLAVVLTAQLIGLGYVLVTFGWWIGPFKSIAVRQIESKYDASESSGEIVFYGASNFRLWHTMETDMVPYAVRNHGMGGCNDAELLRYADRVLYPYAPRVVFVQTGSNDNTQGLTPEELKSNKENLYGQFRENLPDTVFIVMTGLPCPARSEYWEDIRSVNEFIAQYCEGHDGFYCIDATTEMLTADGDFRPELFNRDGIHLNADGHAIWTELTLDKLTEIGIAP